MDRASSEGGGAAGSFERMSSADSASVTRRRTSRSSSRRGTWSRKGSSASGKPPSIEGDSIGLDLQYVTPQLVAIGLPSNGDATNQNGIKEVVRFFEARHPDSYLLVHLGPEARGEHGTRVENFPLNENKAQLETMRPICSRIQAFWQEKEDNVVGIVCKAGKGRTGVVKACLLLQLGICGTPDEAISCHALGESQLSVLLQRSMVACN
mmetsp:Transcript_26607/g.67099  ORF Transcript_26607/g.67099 Transcript_26607/m.67099 type:complete len:209 (+) Transcript_26607:3-629(+)